jgi:hypothetical protein
VKRSKLPGENTMKKRIEAALPIIYAALLLNAGTLWGQEAAELPAGEERYTLHFSGDLEGTVTVKRDGAGKVTLSSNLSGEGSYYIYPDVCPLIPAWAVDIMVDKDSKETTIEGATLTETHSDGWWKKIVMDGATTTTTNSDDYWSKTVVDGNTTTTTDSDGNREKRVVDGATTTSAYSDGGWSKTVVEGNTTTTTDSDGGWIKWVVEGNATTATDSDGYWYKTVTEGTITTTTYSSGSWEKTVVDSNITTYTNSDGYKELVDKRGYDIFIYREYVEVDAIR